MLPVRVESVEGVQYCGALYSTVQRVSRHALQFRLDRDEAKSGASLH